MNDEGQKKQYFNKSSTSNSSDVSIELVGRIGSSDMESTEFQEKSLNKDLPQDKQQFQQNKSDEGNNKSQIQDLQQKTKQEQQQQQCSKNKQRQNSTYSLIKNNCLNSYELTSDQQEIQKEDLQEQVPEIQASQKKQLTSEQNSYEESQEEDKITKYNTLNPDFNLQENQTSNAKKYSNQYRIDQFLKNCKEIFLNDLNLYKSLQLCLKDGLELAESIQFHEKLAIDWLKKLCNNTISELLANHTAKFEKLLDEYLSESKASKFNKQQALFAHYCQEIIRAIGNSVYKLPNSLKVFIYCMFIQGRTLPVGQSTNEGNQTEEQNSKSNNFVISANQQQQAYLSCFFVISYILIDRLLLEPHHFISQVKKTKKNNLIFLASVIQMLFVENYLKAGNENQGQQVNEAKANENENILLQMQKSYQISDKLYPLSQVQLFLSKTQELKQMVKAELASIGNALRSQSEIFGQQLHIPIVIEEVSQNKVK